MSANTSLLLRPEETRTDAPLEVFGNLIYVKLGGSDTRGNYAIMENVAEPQSGPPLHRHTREDESFYVIEGEYFFEVDGKQFQAGPGSCVFAPRGTAHTFQNIGVTPGRMMVIVQPAGLDAFFADLDDATHGLREPDLSIIVPVFEKHGLELLGPPLAARSPEPQKQTGS